MKKYTSQEIKEFVSKPLFDEKIILNKDPNYPRISIVTPSYNQAQFLERTILSVLNQNYPNLEYIIIDGGSTDGSVEIIKKYEKYLNYWVSEKDNGQADAIDKGFKKTSGEILAWLNSDDTYLPETFCKIIKNFKQNPKADLIFGNIYFIEKNDLVIGELRLTKLSLSNFLFEDISLAQPATFWTRSSYYKIGGINTRYHFCMDFEFFTRIAKSGQLTYIREYLASFRIHKNSKTSNYLYIWRSEHDEIVKCYLPKKVQNYKLFYRKIICHINRIFYYFLQGDLSYILKKCLNRLYGISFLDELKY